MKSGSSGSCACTFAKAPLKTTTSKSTNVDKEFGIMVPHMSFLISFAPKSVVVHAPASLPVIPSESQIRNHQHERCLRVVRFGFAARCEARLCLADKPLIIRLGFALDLQGLRPNQGHSP